jgi:hypothetical protein
MIYLIVFLFVVTFKRLVLASINPAIESNDILIKSGRLKGSTQEGLDGWSKPQYCRFKEGSNLANREKKEVVPGFFENRIALLITRHSFRGYAGLHDAGPKYLFEFRKSSYDIQMATNRAFVKNIIEPLEALGVQVDVYLQSFTCVKCSAEINATYIEAAVKSFGSRVVATRFLKSSISTSDREIGQSIAIQASLDALRTHMEKNNVFYRSALIWRWDMVPPEPLAGGDGQMKALLERYMSNPTYEWIKKHAIEPQYYLLWASTYGGRVIGDQIFSIPGWQLGCYFGIILNKNLSYKKWWNQNDQQMEWEGWHESLSKVWQRDGSNRKELIYALGYPQIYRGQYGRSHHDGGKFVCRLLRERFGGPSCSAIPEAYEACQILRQTQHYSTTQLETFLVQFWERVKREDDKRSKDSESIALLDKYHLQPNNDEDISKEEFFLATRCWNTTIVQNIKTL